MLNVSGTAGMVAPRQKPFASKLVLEANQLKQPGRAPLAGTSTPQAVTALPPIAHRYQLRREQSEAPRSDRSAGSPCEELRETLAEVPVPAEVQAGFVPFSLNDRALIESPLAPAGRVAQILAVVDRIEVLLQRNVPTLVLQLTGQSWRSVEVERTGPRTVALRVQARRGVPSAQDLSLLREAIAARGLELSALSVS